jgi:hypothetical protein
MKTLLHVVVAGAVVLASAVAVPIVALAQVGPEVSIRIGPPLEKVETIGVSPGAGYVWHRGEWGWSPERASYVWHPGHWVMHPDGLEVWSPGQWVFFNGGWREIPGHWRGQKEAPPPEAIKMVQVTAEPPAEKVEVIPPRVSSSYDWCHGHWAWTGLEYRWVPGHWGFVPSGFHERVGGHWYRSGGFWFFSSGYWR